jgi:hypothetical protein
VALPAHALGVQVWSKSISNEGHFTPPRNIIEVLPLHGRRTNATVPLNVIKVSSACGRKTNPNVLRHIFKVLSTRGRTTNAASECFQSVVCSWQEDQRHCTSECFQCCLILVGGHTGRVSLHPLFDSLQLHPRRVRPPLKNNYTCNYECLTHSERCLRVRLLRLPLYRSPHLVSCRSKGFNTAIVRTGNETRWRKQGSPQPERLVPLHNNAAVFCLRVGSYAVIIASYLTPTFGSPEPRRQPSTRAIPDCWRVPSSPSTYGAGRVWVGRHVRELQRKRYELVPRWLHGSVHIA